METKEMTFNGRAVKRVTLGGELLWEKSSVPALPQWAEDSILLWYDVKRQGCTNESLTNDPRLIDLSGKGNDLTLMGFVFDGESSGMTQPGLLFNGRCNYGKTPNFRLSDFTIIIDHLPYNQNQYGKLISKCVNDVGIVAYTNYDSRVGVAGVRSFNTYNSIDLNNPERIIITPTSVNGIAISRGYVSDEPTQFYVCRDANPNINAYYYRAAFRSMLIFSRALSDDEVSYVVDNILTKWE